MGITEFKIIGTALVILMTFLAAYFPFKLAYRDRSDYHFPIGNALSSGIFLGAALLHMLAEAAHEMRELGIHYPVAYFFAGGTFLILLLLEHVGMELQHKKNNAKVFIPVLAVIMLSIHSVFEGIALGGSETITTGFVILIAILSHKWAASFALAVELNRSSLSWHESLAYFSIFGLATPMGAILGESVSLYSPHHAMAIAILNAMAAGTFLYIGTLHGLQGSVMVEKCCDLKTFAWVIIGFLLMAVVPFLFH